MTDIGSIVRVTLLDGSVISGRLTWQDAELVEISVANDPGRRQREIVFRSDIAAMEPEGALENHR